MVKLKKGRVKIHICSTCKGNGFVKIIKTEDRESYVHQCWDCDSEGEFYETVEVPMVPNDSEPEGSLH